MDNNIKHLQNTINKLDTENKFLKEYTMELDNRLSKLELILDVLRRTLDEC